MSRKSELSGFFAALIWATLHITITKAAEYKFELWDKQGRSTKTPGGDVRHGLLVVMENPGQDDQVFGTVCADGFDLHAADIVCRELDFHMASGFKANTGFWHTAQLKLLDVRVLYGEMQCEVYSRSFDQCLVKRNTVCAHSQDVVMECVHDSQIGIRGLDGSVEVSIQISFVNSTSNDTTNTSDTSYGILIGTMALTYTELFFEVEGTILWDPLGKYQDCGMCVGAGNPKGFRAVEPARGRKDFESVYKLRVLTAHPVCCIENTCSIYTGEDLFSYQHDHFYDMVLICIPENSAGDVIRVVACEQSTAALQCSSGEVINIFTVLYGIMSNENKCNTTYPAEEGTCVSDKSISHYCNGQETCLIEASNTHFGDPCPSFSKYLEVTYSCQQISQIVHFGLDEVEGENDYIPVELSDLIVQGMITVSVTEDGEELGIACWDPKSYSYKDFSIIGKAACAELGYNEVKAFKTSLVPEGDELNVSFFYKVVCSDVDYRCRADRLDDKEVCGGFFIVTCSASTEKWASLFDWTLKSLEGDVDGEGILVLENGPVPDKILYPYINGANSISNDDMETITAVISSIGVDTILCSKFEYMDLDAITFVTLPEDISQTSICIPIEFKKHVGFDGGGFSVDIDSFSKESNEMRCNLRNFVKIKCSRAMYKDSFFFSIFPVFDISDNLETVFAVTVQYKDDKGLKKHGFVCNEVLSKEKLSRICKENHFNAVAAYATMGDDPRSAYSTLGVLAKTPVFNAKPCGGVDFDDDSYCYEDVSFTSCSVQYVQLLSCADIEKGVSFMIQNVSETVEDEEVSKDWGIVVGVDITFSFLKDEEVTTILICSGSDTPTATGILCGSKGSHYTNLGSIFEQDFLDNYFLDSLKHIIYISNIKCDPISATRLSDCEVTFGHCPIEQTLVLNCTSSDNSNDPQLSIQFSLDGNESYSGIVNHGLLLATLHNTESHGNKTGTVCDDSFTDSAATTICQEMGFFYSASYNTSWYSGPGSFGRARRDTSITEPPSTLDIPRGINDILYDDSSSTLRRSTRNTPTKKPSTNYHHTTTPTRETSSPEPDYEYDIVLDEVQCPDLSSDFVPPFSECQYRTIHDCSHSEDVFLLCSGLVFRLTDNTAQPKDSHFGYVQAILFEGESNNSLWAVRLNSVSDADRVCTSLGYPKAYKQRKVFLSELDDHNFYKESGTLEFYECTSQSNCTFNFIEGVLTYVYYVECMKEKTGPLGLVDKEGDMASYNGLMVTKYSEEVMELVCAPHDGYVARDFANYFCDLMGLSSGYGLSAIDTSVEGPYQNVIQTMSANGNVSQIFCDMEENYCRFQRSNDLTCPYAYSLDCSPVLTATKIYLYSDSEEVNNNGMMFVSAYRDSENTFLHIPICSTTTTGDEKVIHKFCEWFGFFSSENQYEIAHMEGFQLWADLSGCSEEGGFTGCTIRYITECESGAIKLLCHDPEVEFSFWDQGLDSAAVPSLSGVLQVTFRNGTGPVSLTALLCSAHDDVISTACKQIGFERGFTEYREYTIVEPYAVDYVMISSRCSEETGSERCGYDLGYPVSADICSGIQVNCSTNLLNVNVRNDRFDQISPWQVEISPTISYSILAPDGKVTEKKNGGFYLAIDYADDTAKSLCRAFSGFDDIPLHSSVGYEPDYTKGYEVVAMSYDCSKGSESLDLCTFDLPSGDYHPNLQLKIVCTKHHHELKMYDEKGIIQTPGQESQRSLIQIVTNHDFNGNYIGEHKSFVVGDTETLNVDSIEIFADIACKSFGYSGSLDTHEFHSKYIPYFVIDYCFTTFACPSVDSRLEDCSTNFKKCGEEGKGVYMFSFKCYHERLPLEVSYSLKNNEMELVEYYGVLSGSYVLEGTKMSGTICGNNFNVSSGDVLCNKMGYDYFTGFELNEGLIHFNDGNDFIDTKIIIDEVRCFENSTCDYIVREPSICSHDQDILLRCGYNDQKHTLHFHLMSDVHTKSTQDFSMTAGLLVAELRWENSPESQTKSRMGIVCDDDMSLETADSICRYMGFHKVDVFSNNMYEPFISDATLKGEYIFLLDDVECNPGVNVDCPSYNYRNHDCKEEEAVNLWCGYDADNCENIQLNGYLKTQCRHPDDTTKLVYRCPRSDLYYSVLETSCHSTRFSDFCKNDPSFYQVCGHRPLGCENEEIFVSNNIACGSYVCQEDFEVKSGNAMILSTRCNGRLDCDNSEVDEIDCEDSSETDDLLCYNSGSMHYKEDDKCNNVCDCAWCDDESDCNGHQYGTKCDHPYAFFEESSEVRSVSRVIPPTWICDGVMDCLYGDDELDCLDEGDQFDFCHRSKYSNTNQQIRLNEVNRCSVESELFGKVCEKDDFHSQYNCADKTLQVLQCTKDNQPVTVSSHFVCTDRSLTMPELCDDGIDKLCDAPESKCTIHKHQNCDFIYDCNGSADENRMLCKKMTTQFTCRRKFIGNGYRERTIPYSWVFDGVEDCEDGSDEVDINFPKTCGTGNEMRRVEQEKDCTARDLASFKCFASGTYIDLSYVCDRIESCGNENRMCEVSRNVAVVFSKVHEDENHTKDLSYCLPGLRDLNFLKGGCVEEEFPHPFPLLDVSQETIRRPEVGGIDCGSVFGELYVYLSCSGQCVKSPCPLRMLGDTTSCSNIEDTPTIRHVMALNNDLLTTSKAFMISKMGQVHVRNNFFRCDNGFCVEYSKVCNLVDDCGDESDEEICNNNFRCSNGDFVPRSSKCDGRSDCLDLSDECNDECTKDIVDQIYLIIVSWIIGVLACLANFVIIAKSIYEFRGTKSAAAMMNKLLIFFISVGDFLMGIYLVVIGVISTRYRLNNDNYCKSEFAWLTSWQCATLGVISSFGSEISLISMTVLSISRLLGIRSVFAPRHLSFKMRIKLLALVIGIITISMLIAVAPLFDMFEDFFVNGLYYEDVPLFIGAPNIKEHLAILSEYFSVKTWPDKWASWDKIRTLVRDMFSSYSDVAGKKQHFYGNDGVCLFKFFADNDDPQASFIWAILGFNFMCFVIITVSYIFIHFFSAQSTKSVSNNVGNKDMQKRNQKLQRKISLIILTDFCCWIPLILICVLHYTRVLELSNLYPFFSTLILPINSVINPLLYDTTVGDLLSKMCARLRRRPVPEQPTLNTTVVVSNQSAVQTIPMQTLSRRIPAKPVPSVDKVRNRASKGKSKVSNPVVAVIDGDSISSSHEVEISQHGSESVKMVNTVDYVEQVQVMVLSDSGTITRTQFENNVEEIKDA